MWRRSNSHLTLSPHNLTVTCPWDPYALHVLPSIPHRWFLHQRYSLLLWKIPHHHRQQCSHTLLHIVARWRKKQTINGSVMHFECVCVCVCESKITMCMINLFVEMFNFTWCHLGIAMILNPKELEIGCFATYICTSVDRLLYTLPPVIFPVLL